MSKTQSSRLKSLNKFKEIFNYIKLKINNNQGVIAVIGIVVTVFVTIALEQGLFSSKPVRNTKSVTIFITSDKGELEQDIMSVQDLVKVLYGTNNLIKNYGDNGRIDFEVPIGTDSITVTVQSKCAEAVYSSRTYAIPNRENVPIKFPVRQKQNGCDGTVLHGYVEVADGEGNLIEGAKVKVEGYGEFMTDKNGLAKLKYKLTSFGSNNDIARIVSAQKNGKKGDGILKEGSVDSIAQLTIR
jgi:hypothetical protein